jgi:predicted CoA-binding protein
MSKIDSLVHDFLAQKKIAVVGVSDKRETGCNLGYRKFKGAGYAVYAVNPRLTTFDGDPCYPDLRSIPEKPEAVFILAAGDRIEPAKREEATTVRCELFTLLRAHPRYNSSRSLYQWS